MNLKIATLDDSRARGRARHVEARLRALSYGAEHLTISDRPLRQALAEGACDAVVHSLADLPTGEEGRFHLVVPARFDARDALVSRDRLPLNEFPAGSKIGASGAARLAQLRALRPDLEVIDVGEGVDKQEVDGYVLAYADLIWSGRPHLVSDIFDPDVLIPGPAQGAVAVECRADDARARMLLQMLMHADAYVCVAAERTAAERLATAGDLPFAAHATVGGAAGDAMSLLGGVFAPDGSAQVVEMVDGPGADPSARGEELAELLIMEWGPA